MKIMFYVCYTNTGMIEVSRDSYKQILGYYDYANQIDFEVKRPKHVVLFLNTYKPADFLDLFHV